MLRTETSRAASMGHAVLRATIDSMAEDTTADLMPQPVLLVRRAGGRTPLVTARSRFFDIRQL
jgi:hypothetical protein